MAPSAHARPKGMPLVVPMRRLSSLRQLNRSTSFNLLRLSQVAIGNTGQVTQTAVVDVFQQNPQSNQRGAVPLYLLARDVPLIQQLNQGVNLNVVNPD